MKITAKYAENGSIFATIDGIEIFVPDDMSNRHRQMIADWEAKTPANKIESFVGPTLVEQKATAKAAVIAFAEQIGEQLTDGYPAVEREAWVTKLDEAKAIVAGEIDPLKYPVISAEISVTGQLSSVVAPVIIGKAALFQKASGLISGMRQQTFLAIDAATGQVEIDVVIVAAKLGAETALAGLLAVK